MKILIVDDNPQRYSQLRGLLDAEAIGDLEIEFVNCTRAAEDCLEDTEFDLMVLDVLIPRRPDSDPAESNSSELLMNVMETGEYCIPRRIIGITEDETAAKMAEPIFTKYLWTILHYARANEAWLNTLVNCCAFQAKSKLEPSSNEFLTELVVLCAVRDSELEHILKLPYSFGAAEPVDDLTFVHHGVFDVGKGDRKIVAACAPRMGMVATSILASKLISEFRPRYIAMVGICAGLRSKTKIGDVLFIDPCWDWQTGKIEKDNLGETRQALDPHYLPADSKVRANADLIVSDKSFMEEISASWSGARPATASFKVGPVASGSSVLADPSKVSDIKDQNRKLVGIEMEAYGLFAAAQSAAEPRPGVFAMKSVCDFGDELKSDEHQAFAAYSSAKALEILIRDYGDRLFS